MASGRTRQLLLPVGSGLLALLVVAPLLRPGTVLLQDMVFVPDQPWRAQWLGLSSGLPRAVPADAVVAAVTAVVDGAVLQKAVLGLSIALAALGTARLVPARSLLGRAAAGVAYAWNPYVAERLLMGQWTLLVAYAALPWVVHGALAVREGRAGAVPRTLLAVGLASLTATGGLLAAALAVVATGRSRRLPLVAAGALALQLPWLVPGLLHPGGAGSDPAAVGAFAARAESWAGALGSVLSGGGIWNSLAVPASRTTWWAPLLTAALVVVAGLGAPVLVRRWGRRAVGRLGAAALAALLVSLLGVLPLTADLLVALVERVPGAGLLRDGQKWLPPWTLLVALGVGLGVERLAAVPARRPLAVLALLLPMAALPDLAWGAAGRLSPVPWPADFAEVAAVLESDPHPGVVVSLPFTAYRAYSWNGDRPSLDPVPRWYDREVVFEDALRVGALSLDGEDERVADVRRALAQGEPLGELGVGWLVVARRTPGEVPSSALAGAELVVDGADLQLWRVPDVRPVDPPTPPAAPVLLADALALGVLAAAAGAAAARPLRSRLRGRG